MKPIISIVTSNREIEFENCELIFAENFSERNRAIHRARGKFLTFLDDDDSLAPKFEMAIEVAEKYSAEIVRGRKFFLVDEDQKMKLATKEHYDSQNPIELLPIGRKSRITLLTNRQISQDLSGTIFNRNFLLDNRIEFVANSNLLFSLQALFVAKRYICIDFPSFVHRNREPENFSKRFLEIMKEFSSAEKILKDPIVRDYFLSQAFEEYRGEEIENLDEIIRPIFGDQSEFIERLVQLALRPLVQVSIDDQKFMAIK